jgi:hypothetical protein
MADSGWPEATSADTTKRGVLDGESAFNPPQRLLTIRYPLSAIRYPLSAILPFPFFKETR